MQERKSEITLQSSEWEQLVELHDFADKSIIELGCGQAELTRQLATTFPSCRILALEVDEHQLKRHQQVRDLPNVEFKRAGAQDIPAASQSADFVFMFKSLHHVPLDFIEQAWSEIHRVLKPGGIAHISEPVFQGEFNEILRIFHDESHVRAEAFKSIQAAAQSNRFELVVEKFYNSSLHFKNYTELEERVLGVTHTEFNFKPGMLDEVKAKFDSHMTEHGVLFSAPQRVDVLRRI